ncbi:MAG: hypothetical protein IV105_04305 [Rhizobacter sp.]|nr:hypothetical protein [Rhizobacter sp.]
MNPGLRLPAAQRLAASRERMRVSMTRQPAAAADGTGPVLDALKDWWAAHPLHVAGVVAADAAKTLIGPVAQRHPIALVAGALLLGGALVWAKPWRGILKPALLAGLLPQLLSKAMAVVPIESWLAVLSSLTRQAAPAAAPEPNPKPDTPQAPQAPLH